MLLWDSGRMRRSSFMFNLRAHAVNDHEMRWLRIEALSPEQFQEYKGTTSMVNSLSGWGLWVFYGGVGIWG